MDAKLRTSNIKLLEKIKKDPVYANLLRLVDQSRVKGKGENK